MITRLFLEGMRRDVIKHTDFYKLRETTQGTIKSISLFLSRVGGQCTNTLS
jgi:hypothetical protein